MNVLDLFSGCGGLSSGFELAGFKIAGGVDIDPDCIKTFQNNFPKSKAVYGNLLEYSDDRILEDFEDKDIDVIVGGPPCQGFSSANRWHKENTDPRNKLFFEYLRFVELLKPRAVVIENVRGILTRDKGFAKNRIETLLNNLGYRIDCKVLNASDYGVPQNRLRAFFVAIREDLEVTFDFTKLNIKPKVSVLEAIGELYTLDKIPTDLLLDEPSNNYTKYLRTKNQKLYNHEIKYPAEMTQKRISHVPQGGNWQDIPADLFPNNRNNRHSSAYKRLDETACSVTIDTGNAHSNYFHPLYNRIPTVREAARIQSFKDDFILEGPRTSQYRQIGNAVPPLLAKAVAVSLKKYLNSK
tara:strand:+ start:168 stop:1229 length:1062 start_codon:yes stop_codon:yes gene_type:complete